MAESEGIGEGALDRDARIEARRQRIEARLGAKAGDAEGVPLLQNAPRPSAQYWNSCS